MKNLFAFAAGLLLASTTWAAASALVADVAEAAQATVAVHYKASFTPAAKPGLPAKTMSQDWYFVRQPGLVATLRPDNAEIWRQTSQGLSLERVFYPERTVVEYTPGELRTLQVQPSWHSLTSIFDAGLLSQLKPGKSHGQLQDYSGSLGNKGQERIRLSWDSQWQLPQRLQRQTRAGKLLLQRVDLQASPLPGWPQPETGQADFARLDASDFGDMDYNPVVRKAQALDVSQGWRSEHSHE